MSSFSQNFFVPVAWPVQTVQHRDTQGTSRSDDPDGVEGAAPPPPDPGATHAHTHTLSHSHRPPLMCLIPPHGQTTDPTLACHPLPPKPPHPARQVPHWHATVLSPQNQDIQHATRARLKHTRLEHLILARVRPDLPVGRASPPATRHIRAHMVGHRVGELRNVAQVAR